MNYVKNEVPKPFKVPNLATQPVISANMYWDTFTHKKNKCQYHQSKAKKKNMCDSGYPTYPNFLPLL